MQVFWHDAAAVTACRCLEREGLSAALRACERYFFLGLGDWGDALVGGLCAGRLAAQPLATHSLDKLLEAAVQVACTISTAQKQAAKAASAWLSPDIRRKADQTVAVLHAQASSAAQDPFAARLRLRPDLAACAAPAGARAAGGLHALQLSMDVQWPLSIILSQVRAL